MDLKLASQMIFGVVGGLGIFLLGMKNMSEGMQAVAGNKLRRLISAVTDNRLIACGVGALVTSIIQSSSVTTVMAVGMVNAGLMNLMQAIGVILGANIGTTITGWILVLKVGKYGLPLLGISAFLFLFTKRERVRFAAMVFLGLGMVFFGLELMKNGFAPIKQMPEFEAWLSRFTPHNYLGVLKCCLVGAALTAVVQSSSATIGITMGLASTGVITFPTAAALVLGENIGTTITAWLASLGASRNAKRASYAHVMVNLLGVAWITAIFQYYVQLPQWLFGVDPGTTVIQGGKETFPHIIRGIASIHTGFNVINALVFLPLMGVLARLLHVVVPEVTYKETPHLRYLDVKMLSAPALGIQQSRREILVMAEIVEKMMYRLRCVIENHARDQAHVDKIFRREDILDVIQKEIVEFLSNMLSGNVSHEVMNEARRQLRMADEYESVGDYVTAILKLRLKLEDQGLSMGPEAQREILDLHDHVSDYVKYINDCVRNQGQDVLRAARAGGGEITHLMKEYRSRHLVRVEAGSASPLKSLIFTDMLNAYRRIKDHSLNIAEVLAGEK